MTASTSINSLRYLKKHQREFFLDQMVLAKESMQKLADALPKDESAKTTPDVMDKTFLPTGVKHQLVQQDINRRFQDFNRWSQLQSDQGSEDECPTFNN